jgi:hypothetical protein
MNLPAMTFFLRSFTLNEKRLMIGSHNIIPLTGNIRNQKKMIGKNLNIINTQRYCDALGRCGH